MEKTTNYAKQTNYSVVI